MGFTTQRGWQWVRQHFQWVAKADVAIALSSAIIALCVLGTTFWQGYAAVYHNKIQTVPALQLRATTDAKGKAGCSDSELGITEQSRSICLENSGPGPARIIGIEAMLDGSLVPLPHGLRWRELFPQLERLGLDPSLGVTMTVSDIDRDMVLKAGGEMLVVRYPPPRAPRLGLEELVRRGKFDLGICYCNFYSDCFHVSLGSPELFSENKQSCQHQAAFNQSTFWAPRIDRSLIERKKFE